MKRSEHWPYGRMEESDPALSRMEKSTIKGTVAIMVTVLLSLWLGLMFARGL